MPVDYVEAEAAILSEFATAWGAAGPVDWPNTDFRPPALTHGETPPAIWARPSILGGEARHVDGTNVGTRRFRHPGVLTVQVFVQADRGDGLAKSYAQVIASHFQATTAVDGVTFRAATIRAVGKREESGGLWYQVNASIPFQWDSFN